MLNHYKDLLRQYGRLIILGTVTTAALACALSLLLQNAMPIYKGRVTVNMQPSEEALMFNKGFMGVSQFNPATIIVQTHIERILSREVAERALDILLEDSGGTLPAPLPDGFDRFKAAIWRNWALLNYGFFQPADERTRMVNNLMAATSVEVVEGSYILLIEIAHENPALAARAANALAQAYIDAAGRDFRDQAESFDATLAVMQAEQQELLAELQRKRRELEGNAEQRDPGSLRAILLGRRDVAEQALLAGTRNSGSGSASPERNAALKSALEAAEAALARHAETEAEIDRTDQQIRQAQAALAQLQDRAVSAALSRQVRMDQVRVLSAARTPLYPVFPKTLVNTVVAAIAGAILMLVPVMAIDVLDSRVRTQEDLRRAVGPHALPNVTRRLSARAMASLTRPRRKEAAALRDFADALGRGFMTGGQRRRPERRVHVTGFGTPAQISRLAAVIEAALQLVSPAEQDGAVPPRVVILPPVARLDHWPAGHGSALIIGVPAGQIDAEELHRVVTDEGSAAGQIFLAVQP